MHIHILAVGKLKEKYWRQAVDEYCKRLTPYARIDITEVADEPAPETLSPAEAEAVKRREAERLLAHIKERDLLIALAVEGKSFSSEEWAAQMERWTTSGYSRFAFLIGGSLGLHDSLLSRAELKLSFSRFTFPHQLMRVILLEQLYRGFRIMRGEPYHK